MISTIHQEANLSGTVSISEVSLSGVVTIPTIVSIPIYEGEYSVTPKVASDVVLPTNGKQMQQDWRSRPGTGSTIPAPTGSTRWSATIPHRQTGHRTLCRPCIPSSTWLTPGRRMTPFRQSGAWSTYTDCTTLTLRITRSTSAPAPERRLAVLWYCNTCRMSWWDTTSQQ